MMWDSSSFMLQNLRCHLVWSKPTWEVSLLRLGPPPKKCHNRAGDDCILGCGLASQGTIQWTAMIVTILATPSTMQSGWRVCSCVTHIQIHCFEERLSNAIKGLGEFRNFLPFSIAITKKKMQSNFNYIYRTCTQHPESTFSGLRWMDPKQHDDKSPGFAAI